VIGSSSFGQSVVTSFSSLNRDIVVRLSPQNETTTQLAIFSLFFWASILSRPALRDYRHVFIFVRDEDNPWTNSHTVSWS
jgi:hypothetical protein